MITESTGNPALGGSAPVKTILTNTLGWKFAVGDDMYFSFMYPPGVKQGGNMVCHVHAYSSNTTAARYIRFQMDYTVVKVNDVVSSGSASGTLTSADTLLPTAANTMIEVECGTIVIPTIATSSDPHFFFKLSRVASVGTAPAAGDNPVMVHMEFEYDIDQIGQA